MSCPTCPPTSEECTCPIKDLSTDCVLYTGSTVLSDIGTNPNTLLTQALININSAIGLLKADLPNYFLLGGVGAGAAIYKGVSNIGVREIKSIVQGSNITVTDNTDDITLSVATATDSVLGVVELATQAEVDAGTSSTTVVTPSTLSTYTTSTVNTIVNSAIATYVSDPSNLPAATETSPGVVERATAVEVQALTDSIRYISPLGLSNMIASQVEADALTIVNKFLTPGRLPVATDTQLGIMEFATSAEALALTVTDKALTPGVLPTASQTQIGISQLATSAEAEALSDLTKVLTPGVLPSASEIQLGLIEVATQAEVDAGTDSTRAVTPSTLANALAGVGGTPPNSTETERGIIEIATQAEVNAAVDDERAVTPAKLASYLDSNLPASRIRNIGRVINMEVGDGAVPDTYSTGGDILTCQRTARAGDLDTFRITFANAMDTTQYYIKVFYEAVSTPQLANDKFVMVFQTVSTTAADLFIEATSDNSGDLVNMYVEIVQA